MSDSIWTHVSQPDAPVNTGAGDQYIYFGGSFERASVRSPRKHAADDLLWLHQRFVHPLGFSRARRILREDRSVFIDASPGSGRTATAKMLLWELRREGGVIREAVLQEEEPWLRKDHITDDDLVWLDLSGADRTTWTAVEPELSALRNTVHEHAAYLTVVLPHGSGELPPELARCRVGITAPPAAEVLYRHLLMAEVPRPRSLTAHSFLEKRRTLSEIARYAQLVAEARERNAGRDDFDSWSAHATRAFSGRKREIADLVAAQADGPQRALLFATAMLHGAHSDAVHQAATALLKAVAHPPDDRPMLAQAPLDQRLKEIKAEMDASGHVRFAELEYDEEVRTYCWTHLPDLHDPVRAWVKESADSLDLSSDEQDRLVQRFARLCLDQRYQRLWVSLVEDWTTQRPTSRRVRAATTLLQEGLRDERHGRAFRRQIYEWSRRSADLTDERAEALVLACRDQMMINHPDEALVRLHHVARREKADRAGQTLVELVRENRRLFRRLLARLVDTPGDQRHWPADVRLFLEIAEPWTLVEPGPRNRPAILDRSVNGQLVAGWHLVFTDLTHEEWRPRLRQWLGSAAENERYRGALLDILIGGADHRWDALASIFDTAFSDSYLRANISDVVLRRISIAQGVPLP